ncbi:hypothetical protein AVEN_151020-1 [Araneus ventricosus]|uniref:Uncharacterized protein n=1 Tax=Araneus ventricosus TaxID=182803 RepID=A0A4Y2IA44_ARAVE|nr:hypothetical protein AVEN_151020-1 [Araneus ventricosus]
MLDPAATPDWKLASSSSIDRSTLTAKLWDEHFNIQCHSNSAASMASGKKKRRRTEEKKTENSSVGRVVCIYMLHRWPSDLSHLYENSYTIRSQIWRDATERNIPEVCSGKYQPVTHEKKLVKNSRKNNNSRFMLKPRHYSCLTKYQKSELIALAADVNVELLPNDTVVNILKKIKESPDYDADFALDTIKCISEEKEIEEKRLERQEATRFAEADQIRGYVLEKLRLTQSNDTASVRSNASNGSQNYRIPSIKSVLSPFDPEKSDISLFLTVFKRPSDKLSIPDEKLVTQLISVLAANMTELIIRDTGDDTDDFEVVKKISLERFRLSTDAYRVKYMTHQKSVNSLWKDLVFELNSYFNGWLEGAEVDLKKDLMIADQIKRRASPEIKTHFVDQWGQMNDPYVVASKFDQYELARKTLRKPQQNKPFDKPSFKRTNSFRKNGKEGGKVKKGQNQVIGGKALKATKPGHQNNSNAEKNGLLFLWITIAFKAFVPRIKETRADK